jgi:hypothetical protein
VAPVWAPYGTTTAEGFADIVGIAPAVPVTVTWLNTGLGEDPLVVSKNFVLPPAGTYGQERLLPDAPPQLQSAAAPPFVLIQMQVEVVFALV